MVLLDRYRVLDITAWGLFFFKDVNIFKNFKMLCWAVSLLHAVSLGGRDVPGCNWTWGTLICTHGTLICTRGTLWPASAGWRIF
jgi:hypothetical protein